MDLNEYQQKAQKTSGAYGEGVSNARAVMAGLALAGEVGELLNLLKKEVAHGHDIPWSKYEEEIGDVIWYLAELASSKGISLDEAGIKNIAKLSNRYPKGFDPERSQNRGWIKVGQAPFPIHNRVYWVTGESAFQERQFDLARWDVYLEEFVCIEDDTLFMADHYQELEIPEFKYG